MPIRESASALVLVAIVVITLLFGGFSFHMYRELQTQSGDGAGLMRQVDGARKAYGEKLEEKRRLEREMSGVRDEIGLQDSLYTAAIQDLVLALQNATFYRSKRDGATRKFRGIEDTGDQARSFKDNAPEYGYNALQAKMNEEGETYQKRLDQWRNQLEQLTRELSQGGGDEDARMDDFRRQRSQLLTQIEQHREELERRTAREQIFIRKDFDGKVVRATSRTKMVIVDIGSSVGVKRGYRFEVFQIKHGNERVHKGYIEVKTVHPEQCICSIVEQRVNIPVCGQCGYAAKSQYERFCPYCLSTKAGFIAQRLVPSLKPVDKLSLFEPIIARDLIYNPFFDPGKELHFVVAGEPLREDLFPTEYIRSVISRYGGILDNEVTVRTDYIVLGGWAGENMKKARELGVTLLHHFEIFPFLER